MSEIIRIDSVSKKYILQHQGQQYTTLRDSLVGAVAGTKQRVQAYISRQPIERPTEETFWALKDVSFSINQGDRVGIIGRNGAGKSTLLKILSRITEPTTGTIKIRGRIASLLEVGTGFHPELTGRENIFLNGAVLGMSRKEIQLKFDEIVAFAEVEKFLDTPVKRYSSGMYVRLAFAVAAHLEPEILIVDEVLAVGDIQFQQKCLGKMEDVGKDGRTVIFVSHNMGAIRQLCSRGVLLKAGQVQAEGDIQNVVAHYLDDQQAEKTGEATFLSKNKDIYLKSIRITPPKTSKPQAEFDMHQPITVHFEVAADKDTDAIIGLGIKNNLGDVVTSFNSIEIGEPENPKITKLKRGTNSFTLNIPTTLFRPGTYTLSCSIFNRKLVKNYDHQDTALTFEITNYRGKTYFDYRQPGIFFYDNATWARVK